MLQVPSAPRIFAGQMAIDELPGAHQGRLSLRCHPDQVPADGIEHAPMDLAASAGTAGRVLV